MSSVPWKNLYLIASVLCFVVGVLDVGISDYARVNVVEAVIADALKATDENLARLTILNATHKIGFYAVSLSPMFAYTHIFWNRQKKPPGGGVNSANSSGNPRLMGLGLASVNTVYTNIDNGNERFFSTYE